MRVKYKIEFLTIYARNNNSAAIHFLAFQAFIWTRGGLK